MARSMERHGTRNPGRERERDLVLAFQSGNTAAYESIDHSCRPTAERICRRLLINPADVEEAVQETMMRAYQGLPRFNGSYALTAWIARIATNVCLDTIRSRSRRPLNGGTIDQNTEPNGHDGNGHNLNPEELVEQAADAEEVRKVLADLPERHRTALVLREFEGLSHRRIAAMLDTSPERVKALLHRAKVGFRRAWTDEHPSRLAAFAPLLMPINWVRRLFGRAPELDHPVAATTAATAAASPAVQSLVPIAGERVSVLATVMLAGAVGFTAQQAPRGSQAQEQPIVVEAAQAVVEPQEAQPAAEPKKKKKRERPKPEPAAEPSPAVEAATAKAEVEDVVLDEPKAAPKPAVVTSPSPTPPPHAAGFTYSFTSDRTAEE